MARQRTLSFAEKPVLSGDLVTLRPVEAADAARARHVYESVGFVHEGTMRDALRWDGEWVDCHLMGMLAGDWERSRMKTDT